MENTPETPDAYTYIYWLIKDNKIEASDLFNFAELFWPTFIEIDNYVFLKENFKEKYYQRLCDEKNQQIEYWLNLFTIDDFFSDLLDGDDQSIRFSKILVEIWKTKLEKDFPHLNFIVKFVFDEEFGDCGLTFYQQKKDSQEVDYHVQDEIDKPNVKENKICHSKKGLNPGISKIRKPNTDETPK